MIVNPSVLLTGAASCLLKAERPNGLKSGEEGLGACHEPGGDRLERLDPEF